MRSEVERARELRQVARVTAVGARMDILDEDRARLGAVRPPQLMAVGAVVGAEVERAVEDEEAPGDAALGAGVDVLDHHGARLGAVRPPQLVAVLGVLGAEVDDPVHVQELGAGDPIPGAGGDVLDHYCARVRPVAAPEFGAVRRVEGLEDQEAVGRREPIGEAALGTGVDVADELGLCVECARGRRQDERGEEKRTSHGSGGEEVRGVIGAP